MNRLPEFRDETRQTQQDVADKMSISLSFYQKIENGIRNPSYNFLHKFKEEYPDQSIDYIFFNSEVHTKCA